MKRIALCVLLATLAVVSVFASGAAEKGTPVAASASDSRYAKDQTLKMVYNREISEWNYLTYSAAGDWSNYIDNLVEYDKYGIVRGALAESWTVSDDGLVYTFKIRKGVAWQYSDGSKYGQDVKAQDWVTSAKYVLDPKNAAGTADYMFTIKGAKAYYQALAAGEQADFSTVGVKALDDYTLEFTLESRTSYFLSTLTFNWGYPTNADYLAAMGDNFGLSPNDFLYNGAYLVEAFEPEFYRYDVKNPLYWDKDNVFIERIENTYNAEAETLAPELFLRGQINYAKIPTAMVDDWLATPEKAQYLQPLTAERTTYWYAVNFWPTYDAKYDPENWLIAANNLNFRKALYYGVNRTAICSVFDARNPEQYMLSTITPSNFAAAGGKDYTQMGGLENYTLDNQFNPELAKDYMTKAVAELKAAGCKFPIICYMPYRTSDTAQTNVAQVVEQQLENLFGKDVMDIVIEGYPRTDYKNLTGRIGNDSFMLQWWGPDFLDPVTYTEPNKLGQKYSYIYMADGVAEAATAEDGKKGNDGGYWKNYIYDEMVAAAKAETDDVARFEKMAEAEAWLIENAYVVPVGTLAGTGYAASYLDPTEHMNAYFGACMYRYKGQHILATALNSQTFAEAMAKWSEERTEALKDSI